jgi:hypothetical protein
MEIDIPIITREKKYYFYQNNQNKGNNRFNHRNNQNNDWRNISNHDSTQGQGNYHQSISWAVARQQQDGPPQYK